MWRAATVAPCRNATQAPTARLWWIELVEVTSENDIEATEGSLLLPIVVLHCADGTCSCSQSHIDVGKETCTDHADFVDDEPTPKKHALGKLTIGSHACTVAISLANVQRMVNCVTRDLYCHGGLQGDGLEVDILLVASHFLKNC